MRFELTSTNLKMTTKMQRVIRTRLDKLAGLLGGLSLPKDAPRGQVKISRHPVKFFQILISLPLPRQTLRVKVSGDRFQTSFKKATEKLSRQIKRYKAKIKKGALFEKVAEERRSR